MNTEQLIRALAIDLTAGPKASTARPLWLRLLLTTLAAALPSLLFILFAFSRSPHLAHGATMTIQYTLATALVLVAVAFWLAIFLSRPETEPRRAWLVVPILILTAGIAAELVHTPRAGWAAQLWGDNPLACFASVFLLSLPILAGALYALRQGAPSHPRLSGATAGLLAGGVTMALYTLHCPEDSLLFIAAWHVPAILFVSLLGAVLGARLLRW